ncbi:TPA: glucose-6-phosphate dehydrogenase [Patescibacteria group bacterium]|nr:MAG: Glucose-6-phosphate 1-dehydrogenase [Parcubacteria group bacterium GW2011_GWF2_40_10]KKR47963.1 MAG: Glucose-6-phosphate 1-dehydrogenase [Parcubacteria group bacterium GW2011_GWA2_40_143]KKR60443.1 MAG: Glucose-6-phosphate 1-dehydrogenase [Parcubacteria group bacterium GW2011_GWC2_40_31]KKR77587.1 MAG: Glucose-6-phosphate 1-dehydrogenase [Parcubacteria group bacterium GW2011_GWE2_40_8]KKR82870.1 MAG: Glucose-6-phosphate 1-dehydrogenase [Parcubacteria group bacterium GW2011_GWD2_40_9]HB
MNNNKRENSKNNPTAIVIFGGTGDLSKKKLLPALFHLYIEGFLPEVFRVIGISRKELSDENYRKLVEEAIVAKGHEHGKELIGKFLENIYYKKGCSGESCTYEDLSYLLLKLDAEAGMCMNKLFYLSVPPSSYGDIFKHLSASGLNTPCGGEGAGWARVLVEKPFGENLETAKALDSQLTAFFKEEQIFRIDHYLAKDAVQNLLAFRFSNLLFEDSWHNGDIEKVHIKLYENFGIEGRGSFYDESGALRDVGQNHMLQILALIAMENQGVFEPENIIKERAKVFQALKIYSQEEAAVNSVRAQYKGYLDTEGVLKDSKTETYFLVKAFIENERWKGVPFYLESGKALGESKVEIVVEFKAAPHCVCGDEDSHNHKNILTLSIQPKQAVEMKFWVKKPGMAFKLEEQSLKFEYEKEKNGNGQNINRLPDAYEKVLYDCIAGDRTLFATSGEVEAAWKFIDPIIMTWKRGSPELDFYEIGEKPKIDL